MDRFSAYLLVRQHLRRPESRNHALVAEAAMEQLAQHRTQDATLWGVLGLLSQLDREYAEQNPQARGHTAYEQARLEGLEADVLRRWCAHLRPQDPPADESDDPREHALALADAAAHMVLQQEPGAVSSDDLEQQLRLCRGRGDSAGQRLDAALTALELSCASAAQLITTALGRVEQDLR